MKAAGNSRLHELHEPNLPFVSRIKFIVLNFRIFPFMNPESIIPTVTVFGPECVVPGGGGGGGGRLTTPPSVSAAGKRG